MFEFLNVLGEENKECDENIPVCEYLTKDQLRCLVIKHLAKKTNYGTGHYLVFNSDGTQLFRFKFYRR